MAAAEVLSCYISGKLSRSVSPAAQRMGADVVYVATRLREANEISAQDTHARLRTRLQEERGRR